MKSWLKTIFEAWIDIGSGFFVALAVQIYLIPMLFGIEFTGFQNVGIVFTFMIVSLIRSTLWRRFFKRRFKNKTAEIFNQTGFCRVCKRKSYDYRNNPIR